MLVTGDRIKETTTSTGTDDITLGGAMSGFLPFSTAKRTDGTAIATGDFLSYTIAGGAESESGIARWNGDGTITRREVTASTNGGNKVDFSAGTKEVFLVFISRQVEPIYPTPDIPGLIWSLDAQFSRFDMDADGRITKAYDISGNGLHSNTMATTRRPMWLCGHFNSKHPGIYFNGSTHHLTVPGMPTLASPLEATFVMFVQHYTNNRGTGNKHIYNYRGAPIGFLGSGPQYYMFNGSTFNPSGSYEQVITDIIPYGDLTNAACIQHIYAGASSKIRVNGIERGTTNPGTTASGSSGDFTLFSNTSGTPGDFGSGLLNLFNIYDHALTTDEKNAIDEYARRVGIVTG